MISNSLCMFPLLRKCSLLIRLLLDLEGFTTLQKSPTLDSSLLLFYSPSLLFLHILLYTLVRSYHMQVLLLLLQF